jgi:hypothetical protein
VIPDFGAVHCFVIDCSCQLVECKDNVVQCRHCLQSVWIRESAFIFVEEAVLESVKVIFDSLYECSYKESYMQD